MNFLGIILLLLSIISLVYSKKECKELQDFFELEDSKLPCCDGKIMKCEGDLVTEIEIWGLQDMNLPPKDFSTFPKLQNLKNFVVEGIKFQDGVIPQSFFELQSLKNIDIMKSNVKSLNIPNTCSLEFLHIYYSSLEEFPSGIANCKNLEDLDLSGNNIGKIPDDIGELKKLKILRLINSNLSEISDKLFDLNLETLHLNDNKLLKPKIYKFKSPVKECSFDESNISCYEEGACSTIIDNPKGKPPKNLDSSNFKQCTETKNDKNNNSGGGGKSILWIIIVIIIIIELFCSYYYYIYTTIPHSSSLFLFLPLL